MSAWLAILGWMLLALPARTSPLALAVTAPGTITAAWDANTDGVTVGYRLYYGKASQDYDTSLDAGASTMISASGFTLGIRYFFVVRAYNAAGTIGPPSNEVSTVLTGGMCEGALQIAVRPLPGGWSDHVDIGNMGFVYFSIANPRPVIDFQVRFGAQVVGHATASAPGDDLRAILGLSFSVPRVAGGYPMTLWAKDNMGCETVTTAPRIVLVQ